MPVDPEIASLLAQIELPATPRLELLEVDGMRATEPLMASWMGEPPELARVLHVAIPGPADSIMARVYVPSTKTSLPVCVYVHGGGWVFGSVQNVDVPLRALAKDADWIVVAPQYRLAPEHRFPAALLDVHAVVQWTMRHAAEFGGDPGRVAIAGDSAGANLALTSSLYARDRKEAMPLHQILLYPVVDPDAALPSQLEFSDGYLLSRASVLRDWTLYLRDDVDRANPYAAPLEARTLRGLPPATIFTNEFDPVRDDGAELSRRLREDGVKVEYRCWEGLVHASFQMANISKRARELGVAVSEALKGVAAR